MKNKATQTVLFMALLTLSTQALAMGVGPSEITIENAMKGGEYKKTAKIFNTDPTESVILIEPEGSAASWITVYPENDLETPVKNLTLAGGENILILMKFNIPLNTANGAYNATVNIRNIPKDAPGIAQSVSVNVPIDITITVTGEQILTGKTRSVTTRDVEINYPLQIKVEFENTGNVVAKPEIVIDVKKDGTVLDQIRHSDDGVEPGTTRMIPVELNTSMLLPGNYSALVSVGLDDMLLEKTELAFNLMPIGTLTRAGSFDEIAYEGELKPGKMIKINALFRNTGRIDTKAKFTGEVYIDGKFADRIESEELLVGVKEMEALVSYLRIDSPGEYVINGLILFEGKKTVSKDLSFTVTGASGDTVKTTTSSTSTLAAPDVKGDGSLNLVVVGVLALLLLMLALLAIKIKSGGGKEKKSTLENI